MCPSAGAKEELQRRSEKATAAQASMRKLLQNQRMPWNIRRRAWDAVVGSQLLYGCEAWQTPINRVRGWIKMKQERAMGFLPCGRADPGQGGYLGLERRFLKTRAMWLGHCLRMSEDRVVRKIVVEAGCELNSEIMGEPWEKTLERHQTAKTGEGRRVWRTAVSKRLKKEFPFPMENVTQQRNKSRHAIFGGRAYVWKQKNQKQRRSGTVPLGANPRGERIIAGQCGGVLTETGAEVSIKLECESVNCSEELQH